MYSTVASVLMALAVSGGQTSHTVVAGETLSSIASGTGSSWQAICSANGLSDCNLIYAGQVIVIPAGGASWTPARSSPEQSDQSAAATAPSNSGGSSGSGGGRSAGGSFSNSSLSSVPGVPSSFAACVAFRESTNGTNQAFNGGVYGIIRASGINVNGQSLAAQKRAFSQLYQQYGTAPWAPSDGC